jgi:tripartite-type tricarboxylate transporter receptor subunit TctC
VDSAKVGDRKIAAFAARVILALLIGIGAAKAVQAQNYPLRLVRFIVPFPPGGGVDLVIRAAAQELSSKWGTPVIVENQAGAGGTIGTDAVFRAAPDGYTLLATVNQTITTAPYLSNRCRTIQQNSRP